MIEAVYALTDPRDGLVKYIGRTTTSLEDRLYWHLCKREGTSRRGRWFEELKKAKLTPRIDILEITDKGAEVEAYWIGLFSFRHPLVNHHGVLANLKHPDLAVRRTKPGTQGSRTGC